MRVKWIGAIVAVAVIAAALAVGSSARTTTVGAAKVDIAGAKAAAQKYLAPLTKLGLPPLKKAPPKNKTIGLVFIANPASQTIANGAIAAIKALHWKYKKFDYDGTPTGLQKSMQAAIDSNVNGIVTSSYPATDYPQQLQEAASKHIPVASGNTNDVLGNGLIANVEPPANVAVYGRVLADWIVATQGDKADVAMFNVPDFPVLVAYEQGFQKEFTLRCPSCTFHPVHIGVADLGKVPSIVVANVQRDPKITYTLMPWGDISAGVRQALDTAGYTSVKIGGDAASVPNLQSLMNGTEDAWVSPPLATEGARRIDALVRYWNHQNYKIDSVPPPIPAQLQVKSNTTSTVLPEVKNYIAQYKKLWHIK